MNNKILKNFIVSSLAVGLVNFSPIILHENNLQIVSVAYAAVENVTASNSAIFDFGEDDPQIVETVKNVAKMRAIQSAKEQAGVYVKSFSKTVNGMLTDDDISAYTSNNITIVDVQYKKIPVQAHDVRGNDTGKIAYMYEATVTAKVDTSDLQNYIRRDEKEKSIIVQQNNDSRKNIEKIGNDFENLRKTAENKTSEQIKSELEKIDNAVLAQQKFDEGTKLIYKDDFKGAILKFNDAIELNPNYAMAYNNRGVAYKKLQNYEQAISDFNQSIQLNPNNAKSYNNIGYTYYLLKNYEQAISDFNQAIQLNPNLEESYTYRGFVYAELKNYEQAIKDYTQSIKINPNIAEPYCLRGLAYEELKNYEQAIKDYTQAIKINKNLEEAYYWRGNAYRKLKKYEQAIKDYTQSIKIDPNFDYAYKDRGIAYDELKNYSQAISDFNKAIQLNPNFYQAYLCLGITYSKLQKYDKAIEYYTQAINLNPNFWQLYYVRGACYTELGQNAKAEEDFAKARQLGWKG